MSDPFAVDWDVLGQYGQACQRHAPYPAVSQLALNFGEAEFRTSVLRSNEDPIPRRLSLYLHLPFCRSGCLHCSENRLVDGEASKSETYLLRLLREIERIAPLFDRDRDVIQLQLGGGTPNFFSQTQIGDLLHCLARQFHLSSSAQRDFCIDIDPRHIDPAGIASLARLGFNHVTLGVHDFDPIVLKAVNRDQGMEQTLGVVEACRSHALRTVEMALTCGLPGQTAQSVEHTMDIVTLARPDRVSIRVYKHQPNRFPWQSQLDVGALPGAEGTFDLLRLASDRLVAGGYRHIGPCRFALPGDDLSVAQLRGGLQHNLLGYTIHADTDLVGMGVGAISAINDCLSQNHVDLPSWEAALDAGRLPIWRGLKLNSDDLLRNDVMQQLLCQGRIDMALTEDRHNIDFGIYFSDAFERLQPLADQGVITIGARYIEATTRGLPLLHVIAMSFDRYIQPLPLRPVHATGDDPTQGSAA